MCRLPEHEKRTEPAEAGILQEYPPPYGLSASMLFAAALCPAKALQQTFPQTPLLSLAGRIPLLCWFSQFHELRYQAHRGEAGILGGPKAALYNELNIMALLKRPAIFVPAIYATTELSLRLGRAYGMPKQSIEMDFTVSGRQIEALGRAADRTSFIEAQALGTGGVLAKLASFFWPRWTWPARFPSGCSTRAQIHSTPRIYPAYIRRGQVWVNVAWMPKPLVLFPFGLYTPHIQMHLPPPRKE